MENLTPSGLIGVGSWQIKKCHKCHLNTSCFVHYSTVTLLSANEKLMGSSFISRKKQQHSYLYELSADPWLLLLLWQSDERRQALSVLSHYIRTAKQHMRHVLVQTFKTQSFWKRRIWHIGHKMSKWYSVLKHSSNKSCGVNISVGFPSIYPCHGNSIAPLWRQRELPAEDSHSES